MTNLERWLRRFEHGAGAAFDWQVTWQTTRDGRRRLLRAVLPEGARPMSEPCPLAMQEYHDGFPSMLGREILRIVGAADDDPRVDPALRAELLRRCGVEEIRDDDTHSQE